jgi:hypothetical protein
MKFYNIEINKENLIYFNLFLRNRLILNFLLPVFCPLYIKKKKKIYK